MRVCLWRHLVVQSRNLGGLLVDLILPCLLFLILGFLNALFGEHFGPTEHKEKRHLAVLLSEFGCLGLPISENKTTVYFSPNSSTAAALIMAMVLAWVNQSCSYRQLCKLHF